MKVVAVLGTYRRGKVIDQTVDHILAAAEEAGAQTERFYLIDEAIQFCDNCRSCCQEEGPQRGFCVQGDSEKHHDAMSKILDALKEADGIVIASPINAGQMTAITKRFVERMLPLFYWPWGAWAPKLRDKTKNKRAVVITSSAMPAIIGRILSSVLRQLREITESLGAKENKSLYLGSVALSRDYQLPRRVVTRARRMGKWLANA